TLERSVALLLKFDEEPSRRASEFQPIAGSVKQMADVLEEVRDRGVSHVQLVLDPITAESVEGAAEVNDLLERR
ncbi:MAG: hypothetical protein ACRDVD_00955, partial [Acidimicrobiia bacterium]